MTYQETAPSSNPMRVFVLAPTGRDCDVLSETLRKAGIDAAPCDSMRELCALIDVGIGSAVIAAEALYGEGAERLKNALGRQPEWSDQPLVIMSIRHDELGPGWSFVRNTEVATHALVLERPGYGATLVSAVRSSLMSRTRQYQVRDELAERRRAQAELAWLAERDRVLAKTATRLLGTDDPDRLINHLCLNVMDFLDCQVFVNYVADPLRRELRLNAFAGIGDEAGKIARLSYGTAVCGTVASSGERIIAEDIQLSEDPLTELVKSLGIQAYCCHPLKGSRGVQGTVSFGTRSRTRFSVEEIDVMESVANLISKAYSRVEAEAALREGEELFRTLADNMSQFAWMADPEGTVFWLNSRWFEYTGMSPSEDLRTSDGWSFHHPDHLERVRHTYNVFFRAGRQWEDTFPLRSKDGHYRWFLSRATPIRNEAGKVVRWFGTNTDITELLNAQDTLKVTLDHVKTLKNEAERANKTKDEFLNVLSHELRTPLMSILGWSQMLLRPHVPTDRARRAAEVIHESAKTQTRLIEDLLDVSRILAGKYTIEKKPADLIKSIKAVTEACRPEAEAKGLHLSPQIDAETSVPVVGDETRLQQAISNLVQNAIKFTPTGGNVEVSAERSEDTVIVRVSDTGRGISREFLPRLFERFSQADGSLSRLHTGLGLGLAIVKHVVEAHGGSISAASGGEGMGATFTVRLPIEKPARVEAVAEECAAVSLAGLKILVVEDEPMIRDLIKVILEDEGAGVGVASSASGALQALEVCKYDLLLSDIGLPGRDGYSLIREIRAKGSDKDLPAIALSGHGRPEDKSEAETSGFQEHMTKPVDADDLVLRVKTLVRRTARASPRCQPENRPAGA